MEEARAWAANTLTAQGTPFVGNLATIEDDNGDHIIDGALGEVMFLRHVCPTAQKLTGNQIGADFAAGGARIDVKTKRRWGPLQPHYVAEIDITQRDHEADMYAFMSMDVKNSVLEYIGCVSKKHFWNLGWLMEAGTWLEGPDGKLCRVKKTCWHLDAETINNQHYQLPIFQPLKKTTTMAQENKPKTFIMFPNDKATNDTHPQWRGKIILDDGREEQIVGWEKTSAKGLKYISGKFEPYRAQQGDSPNAPQAETNKAPF